MSVSDILHKLKSVRRSGSGWVALCPSHDDNRHSMSVNEGEGGRPLLKCHAGCTYEAIRLALGIERASCKGDKRIAAAYDYRDEHSSLLYQSVRFDPKGFSQRRPDGAGGWIYKLNGVRRVPYRLPELLAADLSQLVFIVEGEKDAERLASLGFLATTNAGGAGKWRDEFSEFLRGRHVVIIPDNDEPGREHAAKVSRSLRGIAASVRVLELPDLPPKGDVSDWLDAGGVVDELLVLAEGASETPAAEGSKAGADTPLRVVRMADVQAEVVSWLWHPYIALGKFTLLEGDPGLGKSWLTCAIAAAVSLGRGLPGAERFEPGGVLMLSAEDGLGDTLRPRLDAVGADVSKVFALDEPLTFDAPGLLRLEALIIELNPKLTIIDPLFAFTGGQIDIHKANQCRAVSAPLAAIAERQGCAMLAVRHLGKSRGGGHALNAGIGSIDFTAAARSVLLVGQDPDEPSTRAVVQIKNNLAPHGEAVGYKLEGGQFYWTGASDLTAARILAPSVEDEERSSISEAVDFLRTALCGGGRDAKAVADEAKQAGINPATLRRAKTRLKVCSHKVGMPGTHFQKWIWELPEGAQPAPEGAQTSGDEHLQTSGASKRIYGNNLAEGAQIENLEHLRQGDEHIQAALDERVWAGYPPVGGEARHE